MQQVFLIVYFTIGAVVAVGCWFALKLTSDRCQEVNRLRDVGDEEGARKIEEKLPPDNELRNIQDCHDSRTRNLLYMYVLLAWPHLIFLSIKLILDNEK